MLENNRSIIKKVLLGFAVSGTLVLAASSPYFLANLITGMSQKDIKKAHQKIAKILHYLKRRKIILLREESNGDLIVRLSEKGRKRIIKYKLDDLKIEKPIKWDKKWRLVIFDIPKKLKWGRVARETFRNKLKDLGFYQFQKSVWIYPYDCENEILFLKEIFRLEPFVKYMEINKIDDEIKLRNLFDLI